MVENGVTKVLNDYRKETISDIEYQLRFNIPKDKSAPVTGSEIISFNLLRSRHPVIIDFNETTDKLESVLVNGKMKEFRFENGHIIIPGKMLNEGKNEISIKFIAGDLSLNRNDEYLYTLFVPDRASTAFPCFDQPNLKASYLLTLDVPAGWIAVANGALSNEMKEKERTVYSFVKTKPISTYLFAFVAGKFKYRTKEKNGRRIVFYYRETDKEKVEENIKQIFRLQFDALAWMEKYTGMEYPFNKFSFVGIPSFQYSGMEHPGVVLYRESKLFLDASATQEQILNRAKLISHETAHMWFGDMVTMNWFDDVWLKEVFANFMADKIVNPAFPKIDHKLAFLTDHYPKAYAVDRTAGANAIKQKLDNLKNAGMLYGSIIYHKAPIVMQQLENMLGAVNLQQGLKQYLNDFAYSNADWDDLIAILDSLTDKNLYTWSDVWVKEAGMPAYQRLVRNDTLIITQSDPAQQGRLWPQILNVSMFYEKDRKSVPVFQDTETISLPMSENNPGLILLNGEGLAYGNFQLTKDDFHFLSTKKIFTLTPRQRAVAYISGWENFLNGRIDSQKLNADIELYFQNEEDEQNLNLLLKYYQSFFWRYSTNIQREVLARRMEKLLWERMENTQNKSLKSLFYKTFIKTAYSPDAIAKLFKVWNGDIKVKGLQLSQNDMTTLAYELAVRKNSNAAVNIPDTILEMQLARLENPDKIRKMRFIMPALSSEDNVRDSFFESLKDPANREHEPWVLTALSYLHHPLRAEYSRKYILPSLNMLEEIQATGDIFFPKGWMDATFSGHNSIQAANHITLFLNNNPKLDPGLKQKVLQSADPVYRAAKLVKNKF
ncbi:MAG: hypothetical protein GXO86_06115 [Chlorobi bacterium]|nr:hypothetical protein [Chlorobiota bacterium]